MQVTPEQLVKILLDNPKKGAKQVTLVTRTRPELLRKSRVDKTPCPFAQGIERIAVRSVTLGASYENAANRQRERERELDPSTDSNAEHFQPEALWNGHGERDTAYTVRHIGTGRIYFAVKPAQGIANNAAGSIAKVIEDQWRDVATGQVLSFKADRLAEYLKANCVNGSGGGSGTQHVEHDVQWRTIALDSVVELRYGDVYQLKHAA